MTVQRFAGSLLVALFLSACANIAVVREITPTFTPAASAAVVAGASATPAANATARAAKASAAPGGSRRAAATLDKATACLAAAPGLEKATPLQAGEQYASALETAATELARHPKDEEARRIYNFALARIFALIRVRKYEPWGATPFQLGRYTLSLKGVPRDGWDPKVYEFIPDNELEIGGRYITQRVVRDGLGAPLVAVTKEANRRHSKDFGLTGAYYSVTAVAEFRGSRCEISFHDPVDESAVTMAGHTWPLASDYTSALAILLTRELPERLGILRLLDPDKYEDSTRLIRLRPYNDQRIPLLLVHGLMDTPATWVPLINAMYADPELRQRYQVWVYSYPSGYPYPYTAALLRRELDRARKVFPNHKPIVAVGHSMGGIITRLMLTSSGDKIWDAYFGEPPEDVRMTPRFKALMREMLIFQSRDDIARAIFLNSPHRGAVLAGNWVGKIGRKLIRVPKLMISLGDSLRQVLTLSSGGLAYENLPTSIDSLTASNLFVQTVTKLPLNPRIPFHSIIGDRGKAKAKDHPELGSDGFVPYWSSHLDGAKSEKIIPSNHTGHQSPEGIAEVLRLLHLHLKTAK